MPIDYRTDQVKEKLPESPDLIEGEIIELEVTRKVAPSMWVVFVILGFVPPLFVLWWAVILAVVFIFKLLSRGRTEKLLLTNYRLIHLFPSGKFFMMNSIPYSQITDVRRGKVDSGITGFVLGLLDRLFRVGIVMVFTPESRFASLSVDNIKNPTAVIKFLNDKAGITK